MADTNGTTVVETESKSKLLTALHSEFLMRKTPASKTEQAKLMKDWQAAKKARDSAEAAYVAAQKAEQETVAAIIRARGKGRFSMDGEVFTPMSRGETVYLRTEGAKNVPTFGA